MPSLVTVSRRVGMISPRTRFVHCGYRWSEIPVSRQAMNAHHDKHGSVSRVFVLFCSTPHECFRVSGSGCRYEEAVRFQRRPAHGLPPKACCVVDRQASATTTSKATMSAATVLGSRDSRQPQFWRERTLTNGTLPEKALRHDRVWRVSILRVVPGCSRESDRRAVARALSASERCPDRRVFGGSPARTRSSCPAAADHATSPFLAVLTAVSRCTLRLSLPSTSALNP